MIQPAEFRQDLVSGDWVIISPKRALRPDQFKSREKRKKAPIRGCPFEDPEKTGHQVILTYPNKKGWKVMSVRNKYPAILPLIKRKPIIKKCGPYKTLEARGFHEVIITKNHFKNFAHLDKTSAFGVFKVFQKRYQVTAKAKTIKYFFAFHNWGPRAGASIFHPHYQIIALPIVAPDIHRSLKGAERYFKKYRKCVHCEMIKCELAQKKRIVFQNKYAIAFVPFAAKDPFELRIFPKKHSSSFAQDSDASLKGIIEVLQKSLLKLERRIGDPDYVFFIHTAPINEEKKRKYYHWHIEVIPKISISAGVEVGTGIEITTIDPDEAARILRGQ